MNAQLDELFVVVPARDASHPEGSSDRQVFRYIVVRETHVPPGPSLPDGAYVVVPSAQAPMTQSESSASE